MKKFLLLLLLVPLTLCAEPVEQKDQLVGIWQQVSPAKGDNPAIKLPVWKVLQQDGQFTLFLIANKQAQSIITNQGTYTVVADNVIVEHISASLTKPEMVGKKNKIRYKFLDRDTMVISYRFPTDQTDVTEMWVRVKMELPR